MSGGWCAAPEYCRAEFSWSLWDLAACYSGGVGEVGSHGSDTSGIFEGFCPQCWCRGGGVLPLTMERRVFVDVFVVCGTGWRSRGTSGGLAVVAAECGACLDSSSQHIWLFCMHGSGG